MPLTPLILNSNNNINNNNYNNDKCIYNTPFPKDTKHQLFVLQGEWEKDFGNCETFSLAHHVMVNKVLGRIQQPQPGTPGRKKKPFFFQ